MKLRSGHSLIELLLGVALLGGVVFGIGQFFNMANRFQLSLTSDVENATVEVIASSRLLADIRQGGMSFNFLIRFDDGLNAEGKCRDDITESSNCYDLTNLFTATNGLSKAARHDFYLYAPSCEATSPGHCYRTIDFDIDGGITTLNGIKNRVLETKRDFVLLTVDDTMENSLGIKGGVEFYNPQNAFNDTLTYKGLKYHHGKNDLLSGFLGQTGKWILLRTPQEYNADTIHYPPMALGFLGRMTGETGSTDVKTSTVLATSTHLASYSYASNYIVKENGSSNQNEINFHDENLLADLSSGSYIHFYHQKTTPEYFLKNFASTDGSMIDLVIYPIKIVRYHLSDALSRAVANGQSLSDADKIKLWGKDPCLTRQTFEGDSSGGHWVGPECMFPGIRRFVVYRPSVAFEQISFKLYLETELSKVGLRNKRKAMQ